MELGRKSKKSKTCLHFYSNSVSSTKDFSKSITILTLHGKHLPGKGNENSKLIIKKTNAESLHQIDKNKYAQPYHRNSMASIKNLVLEKQTETCNTDHIDQHKTTSQKISTAYSFERQPSQTKIQKQNMRDEVYSSKMSLEPLKKKNEFLISQNKQLRCKIKQYELYFKEMKLKDIPVKIEQGGDKNDGLKILTLEQKIDTLSYIIKQYRGGNKEQIRQFQRKIIEFKPNIQFQLSSKLAEANQINLQIKQQIMFYQQEIRAKMPNHVSWQAILQEIKKYQSDGLDQTAKIALLKQKIKELEHKYAEAQKHILQNDNLKSKNSEYEFEINMMKLNLHSKSEQNIKISEEYSNLEQTNLNINLRLMKLQNIQQQFKSIQQTLKAKTLIIHQLQTQNIQLIAKKQTFENRFINKHFIDKATQSKIKENNQTVMEVTSKLRCKMEEMGVDDREKGQFLSHLLEKLGRSYQNILTQYEDQIVLTTSQCEGWKCIFQQIKGKERAQSKLINDANSEIEVIHEKRNRCVQLHNTTTFNLSCSSCSQYTQQWGQINVLYEQFKAILENVLKNIGEPVSDKA